MPANEEKTMDHPYFNNSYLIYTHLQYKSSINNLSLIPSMTNFTQIYLPTNHQNNIFNLQPDNQIFGQRVLLSQHSPNILMLQYFVYVTVWFSILCFGIYIIVMEYKQDNIEPHIEKRFQRLEKVGSGAYGYVWKVKDHLSGQIYALKKVFLAFQNDVDAQRTYRQIGILKQLNHPNIVKLYEVIKAQNNLDLYLVFQYIECDLFNAIRDGVLNQIHKKYIIYQLAKALYYLHSAGILHRDLKPSNILIDANCKVKICDFGLSRTLFKYDNQEPIMTEFIATRWYRAPEVLFGSKNYSKKSDMWSLGCVIYQIFVARPLLPGSDSVNQIEKVIEFKGFPNRTQMEELKVQKLDVLLSHFNVEKKPSQHYFKQELAPQLMKLLNNLLQYSPESRWGSQQVLSCQYIEPFHNYQQLIQAKSPVILRINDNVKNDKDFYRNFIHKIYLKKASKNIDRPLLRIPNRSESPKRYAETSLRNKKIPKNISASFHSKNLMNKNPNNVNRFIKKSSKTIHCTSRTSSRNPCQQIKNRQSPGISESKHFSKQTPFFSKQNKQTRSGLKLQEKKNSLQKENKIYNNKNGHRKLHKDVNKSIIKEEANKKMLKRRAFVYL